MSKRVILVSSLLLLIGLLAGWEMLTALTSKRISFNFAVLFVPISIGLLLGMPVARPAAACMFGLVYLFLVMFLCAPLVSGTSIMLRIHDSQIPGTFPMVLVIVAVLGSITGLIHWFLYTPPFDDHLGSGDA